MGPEYVTAQINSCILGSFFWDNLLFDFWDHLENLNVVACVFPTTTNDITVIYKCKCTLDCQGTTKINYTSMLLPWQLYC